MYNYYFDISAKYNPYTFALPVNPNSLPPDNAVRMAPDFIEGHYPCMIDGVWVNMVDYRGTVVFSKTTQEPYIIDELGEIPEDFTRIEPTSDLDVWDGEKWV